MKTNAFTLAETLITLAIIGIVAALTIPSLVQKYQEKATITKVKKFYSVITNAANLAMLEYGTFDNWEIPVSEIPNEDNSNQDAIDKANSMVDVFWQRIIPYLKVDKFCSFVTKNCGTKWDIYNLRGDILLDHNYQRYITFADGVSVVSSWFEGNCTKKYGKGKYLENVCGLFAIDINGERGPNRTGVDSFRFYVTKYGIYPIGAPDETSQRSFKNNCNVSASDKSTGYGCTAWVVINGNMDYLRTSNLDW